MQSFTVLSLAAVASAVTLSSGNPFATTQDYYVNPNYQAELQSSISSAEGSVRDYLTSMMD